MQESALLVGSTNGSYPAAMSCLGDLQLEVTETELGADAIALLQSRDRAVIIVDLPLPDLSAAALVSRVKRHSPATSVILLAGGPEGPQLEDVVPAGADEYVSRPADRGRLMIALARALHRRRIVQQAGRNRPLEVSGSTGQIVVEIVEALCRCLEAKDFLSDGHARTVGKLAARIAMQHGLAEEDVRRVHVAGVLHDLGKVAVDQLILERPRRLTSAEWREVRVHPVRGAEILLSIEPLRDVARYVRHHHERHDGSGYPDGLRGSQIPLPSRIIAVADAYDAMVRPRPYRAADGPVYAANEFRRHAGTQWDAEVVEALFACVPELQFARAS